MAFIKTIRPSEATGEVREMYERQEEHWGYVPNYAKVFSHRPEVMARWGRLLAEIRRPSDDARYEMATFVAAREMKNSSCSMEHGRRLAALVGEEVVVAIAEGREAEVLDARDLAIVQFARNIARDATQITSGQVQALIRKHGLSDAEVFDIAANVAGRCFFTKILDSLGCEPDVSFMSIEQELRDKLNHGRPISHARPEHVDKVA